MNPTGSDAQPGISVCITHYNRPGKLAATLESLAAQTRPPDEVFLWDDCSPGDPTEVAARFKTRFRRFVYHRNAQNRGMPGNLNDVISQARCDLVANLHDADEFHPTLLEKWADALGRFPEAGLVFCGVDAARKSGGRDRVWIHDVDAYTPGVEFFRRHCLGSAGSKIWGTVMVRRSVYQRHLPFDPQFRNWSDVDMWQRICATHGIAYVPEPLLILDQSPTPLRSFTWEKFLITERMPIANIHRLARTRSELRRWLAIQRRVAYACYLRHMAGRAARGLWADFIEGARLAPDIFLRLHRKDFVLARGAAKGSVRFVPTG